MNVVDEIRTRLAAAADPNKAGPMQAYMKSELPYRGVPSPGVKRICREVFTKHPIEDRATWVDTVRSLFDDAEFREERYTAINLTGHRTYLPWQDVDTLPLYEHMVVTGAWWDYVDEIAIRRVGPILRSEHARVAPILRRWSKDDDIWRRRTAILTQLKSKADTDTALLADCIEPSLVGSEYQQVGENFFLRKGIGWALRECGKTDPEWVRSYVRKHGHELSPLSKREATRRLDIGVTDE